MSSQQDAITTFRGEHGFLSNFFPTAIEHEGLTYPSVEHAFQALKSTEREVRRRFTTIVKPGDAKREGRKVKLRPDWEEVKLSVMEELLRIKFKQPYLRYQLVQTGDVQLIEGNTWGDKFWGCIPTDDGGWIGENHLGKLLMKIRDEITGGA